MSIRDLSNGANALLSAYSIAIKIKFARALRSPYIRSSSLLVAAVLIALSQNTVASAQSATGGFVDTLKGLVRDPMISSYLMSKIVGPRPQQYTQDAYSNNANPQNYQGLEQFKFPALPRTTGQLSQPSPMSFNSNADTSTAAPDLSYSSGAPVVMSMRLAPTELKQLSHYDISLLIDRSGSMATRDCPDQFSFGRNVSRWDWCREQTSLLAQQTFSAMPAGITVIPFSSNFQRFTNVSPQSISAIFNSSAPDGSTNLAAALGSELENYFNERDAGIRQKPEMIAIITDGVPDSKGAVKRIINEAEGRMRNPNELKIVFFLIGEDQNGDDFVDGLTALTPDAFASTAVVTRHPFAEVNQFGLPRSLASGLREYP